VRPTWPESHWRVCNRQEACPPIEQSLAQPIVDRFLQILPRSQISLGGLDGRVAAQQELNLLEVPAGCAAELGAGPPEIVGAKLVDQSGLPCVLGQAGPKREFCTLRAGDTIVFS